MTSFDEILNGENPTSVFRRILADNSRTKWDLASEFMEHFDRVDSLAQQVIWAWPLTGTRIREADAATDLRLLGLLRDAGYAVGTGQKPRL